MTSGRRAWAALLVLVFPGRGLAQPVLAVPGDHPSIQAAVDAAPSGGIVEVHAGSYRERIRITKPVTLRSAAGQAVVVEAPGDAPAVEIDGAAGTTIAGLTLRGGEPGVRARGANELTIRTNILEGFRSAGILLVHSAGLIEANHVTCTRTPGVDPPPRGIVVDQGSEATVRANTVDGEPGVGLVVDHDAIVELEENHVGGARPGASVPGTGILGLHGARLTLRWNEVTNNAGGGIVLDGVDAVSSGNSVRDSGDQGLAVLGGSRVRAERDAVRATHAGATLPRGRAIVVAERARLTMREAGVDGSDGTGVSVTDGSVVSLTDSVIAGTAGVGVSVERGSAAGIARTEVTEAGGAGIRVAERSLARIDHAAIARTKIADGRGRGLDVESGAHARVWNTAIAGSAELGAGAFGAGSLLRLTDTRVTENHGIGVLAEREGRVVVVRTTIANHAEIGAAARASGSLSLFDDDISGSGRWGVLVDANSSATGAGLRLHDNAAAFFGLLSKRNLAGASALALRVNPALPRPISVKVLSPQGFLIETLARANVPVAVRPGHYRLVAVSGGRERRWGETDVGEQETAVYVDSGLAFPPRDDIGWRVSDADTGAPVEDVPAGTATLPLKPGRYRVAAADGSTTETIVVRAGAVSRVHRRAEGAGLRDGVLRFEPRAAVPGQAVKLVVSLPPPEEGAPVGSLAVLGPDGQWRSVVPLEAGSAAPHDALRGEHQLELGREPGEYLALLTVREREGADPPLRVAVARLLASDHPIVRLDVEPMIDPGESFRLTLRAGAMGGRRGDVFASVTTAERRSWLVPGGTTAVAIVDDARKAPLLRNLRLADGETVLFDGPLPDAFAGKGPVTVHVTYAEAGAAEAAVEAEASFVSCTAPTGFAGRVVLPPDAGVALPPTLTLERLGRPHTRRTTTVARDGSFALTDLPAGHYTVLAYTEVRDTLYALLPEGLDLGCDGTTGWSRTLQAQQRQAPTVPGGQSSWRPRAFGALAHASELTPSEACADEGGGSADAGQGSSCNCGRLTVCVASTSWPAQLEEGISSAQHQKEFMPKWTKLASLPTQILSGAAVADGLQKQSPCLDVVDMDTEILNVFGQLEKLSAPIKAEKAEADAAAKAGDTARAEEIRAKMRDELAKLMAQFLPAFMLAMGQSGSCQVRISVGGSWSPFGGWTIKGRVYDPRLDRSSVSDYDRKAALANSTVSADGGLVLKNKVLDDLVKQIAPGLDALQKKLFCSEAELSWNCSTTAFPAEPFAPGAHADFVCKYEQRCCGGPVYQEWEDNGAVAGFQGVAGFGSKTLHLCCGEQALDPQSQKEAFCAGTTTYRAHDLDCDGIPNSVDPTPLGDKTGEEMEKILKGEESPDDLDNVLPSDNDSWE